MSIAENTPMVSEHGIGNNLRDDFTVDIISGMFWGEQVIEVEGLVPVHVLNRVVLTRPEDLLLVLPLSSDQRPHSNRDLDTAALRDV